MVLRDGTQGVERRGTLLGIQKGRGRVGVGPRGEVKNSCAGSGWGDRVC
jgi:hypothetical protein